MSSRITPSPFGPVGEHVLHLARHRAAGPFAVYPERQGATAATLARHPRRAVDEVIHLPGDRSGGELVEIEMGQLRRDSVAAAQLVVQRIAELLARQRPGEIRNGDILRGQK